MSCEVTPHQIALLPSKRNTGCLPVNIIYPSSAARPTPQRQFMLLRMLRFARQWGKDLAQRKRRNILMQYS